MANNGPNSPSATIPQGADDLTRIRGINTKIANRLYDAGILTFAKLAAMSADEIIARIGAQSGTSAEAITRKDWIGQARDLASEPEPRSNPGFESPQELRDSTTTESNGLRRADFAVTLQLNAGNSVIQTHVMHMQSGSEEMWDGWVEERLLSFLIQRADLSLAEPAVMAAAAGGGAQQAMTVANPGQAFQLQSSKTISEHKLEVMTSNSNLNSKLLRHNQPFNVRLSLDLTRITVLGASPLAYTATVYAKNFSGNHTQMLGEVCGAITPAENVTLDVGGLTLPQGAYRLGASVIINLTGEDPVRGSNFSAYLEGGILQVC
jgi:nucleotidyltransferase/DNA polymerase involved in DNA repair